MDSWTSSHVSGSYVSIGLQVRWLVCRPPPPNRSSWCRAVAATGPDVHDFSGRGQLASPIGTHWMELNLMGVDGLVFSPSGGVLSGLRLN